MSIEIKENRYFVAFWCVPGENMDYLAALYRDRGERDWQLVYRFRYYRDGRFGTDSVDEKNWYAVSRPIATTTEEAVERSVDSVCALLVAEGMHGPVVKIACKTDNVRKVAARLATMPFAHVTETYFGDGCMTG